jgi:hypothetical protein
VSDVLSLFLFVLSTGCSSLLLFTVPSSFAGVLTLTGSISIGPGFTSIIKIVIKRPFRAANSYDS